MHRHHVSTEELAKQSVTLDRAGARHFINVLRLKSGDEVELFDGKGASATYRIDIRGGANNTTLERKGDVRHALPLACRLVLGVAISKGKRMDWTIEKAVELGVSEVVPILSKNSVVRLDDAEAEDKRERWERVAIDAARQCKADYLPVVNAPMDFKSAMRRIEAADQIYVGALTDDAIPLRSALRMARSKDAPKSAAWVIGPEGDFTSEEYEAFRQSGAAMVSLGNLVLRAETAAIYGLCVLGTEWL